MHGMNSSTPRPRTTPRGVLLDSTSVKVLAHPLRSRLLSLLRRRGPSTATALAGVLETNSGSTSYHLRKLASVGLVEDTGEGRGKERLWRASTEEHTWYPSDFEGDDDAQSALRWLERDYLRHFTQQMDRWIDVSETWPQTWQDCSGVSDMTVLVTAEQLSTLREELNDVVAKYRRVGQGNPDAKRIAVYAYAFPLDLDRTATR